MKEKLKSINMLSFIIEVMLGIRMLTLPRDIIEYAGNDAVFSVLLAGVMAFITGYCFWWLGKTYKGLNISQIFEAVYGKIIGKFIMLIIAVYLLLSVGLALRAFGESIEVYLLDKTPVNWIIAIMLIMCVYCIKMGIKTISIVFDVLLPIILFSIILLFLFALTNIEPANLLPVLNNGVKPITLGCFEMIHPFLGIGVIGYVLQYFDKPQNTKKSIIIGVLVILLIYTSIVVLCIMMFGSEEVTKLVYPTMTMAKTIQFQTEIFERAESIFMTAWIPISFTTILAYYFASVLNFKALFNSKKYSLILYMQIPVILVIAIYPGNIVLVYRYLKYVNYIALLLTIFVIVTPFIVMLKKRRKKYRYDKFSKNK